TEAPTIVLPTTSRARSRAIVSVSGSSGTRGGIDLAFQLSPSDVTAKLLPCKRDPVGPRNAPVTCGCQRLRHSRHAEYPASSGEQFTTGTAAGARVEEKHVVLRRRE